MEKWEHGVAMGKESQAKAGAADGTGSRELGGAGINEVKEGEAGGRPGGPAD